MQHSENKANIFENDDSKKMFLYYCSIKLKHTTKMEKEDSFQTLAGACFPTTIMLFCRSRVAATVKQSKITALKTIIILNYSLDSGLLKNFRTLSCLSELLIQ